jgi:hypothetical protein
MTEAEWLTCEDPDAMLSSLIGQASQRRIRLLVCGLARLLSSSLMELSSWQALELAEQLADGLLDTSELEYARRLARWAIPYNTGSKESERRSYFAASLVSFATTDDLDSLWYYIDRNVTPLSEGQIVSILRDIFGNPFRPVVFDPAWRSSTALAIATGIYDDKAFDRLPILADAIQDTGCENEEILNHLRSDGPHVKGCWALDLVLGKE